MSDTLSLSNALSRSSLLDKITNPVVANPLAAQLGAAQAAEQVWRVREAQAKQASGQAFLNSIGPGGTPDQAALLRGLQADPTTALAAQEAAGRGQTLDTNTFDLQTKRLTQLYGAATALTGQYPNGVPQDVASAEIERVGPMVGLSPAQIAQVKSQFTADPVANSRMILRNAGSMLQAHDALLASRPTTTMHNVGGQDVPLTTAPALSPNAGQMTPGGGPMITRTQTPGELATETPIYTRNADGTYSQVPQPRSDRPGAVTTPTITPMGGGGLPTSPVPPAAGGAAPPPLPKPGMMMPGAYLPRGAPQPTPQSTPQSAPPTPQPTPQPPLLSPPQGQPERLAAGNKLYTEASGAIPDQQKRLIAGESALEAMKLAATGPSTGYVAQAKAWLEARGETPDGTDGLSPAAARQVLQKQLLRFAQDSAKRSGTDLGLETQLHSNANADVMLSSANRHVLLQDIGMLRRDMAMNKLMPQGEAALEHVKNFPTDTDPRGFSFDVMTKEERNAVRADAARTKGGTEKLNRSLEIAHQLNLIKLPSAGQ